jgi:hypothetical protein
MYTFKYSESEALELVQLHFPKTWQNEIRDGQIFIKSLMHMYKINATEAYNKYLKSCGNPYNGIATLAALRFMNLQAKIGAEIKDLQTQQLQYGDQTTALEMSNNTSEKDKRMLREHYISKQTELQQRIDALIGEYPVIGSQEVIVQTNIFKN